MKALSVLLFFIVYRIDRLCVRGHEKQTFFCMHFSATTGGWCVGGGWWVGFVLAAVKKKKKRCHFVPNNLLYNVQERKSRK